MGLGAVLDAIWNLPWYKTLIVAVADDVILVLQLWWLWAAIIGIAILGATISAVKK